MSMRSTALASAAASMLPAAASAQFIDWSTVTLDGDNPFTFEDPTLGTVTITYSGSFKNEGIITNFGSQPLLGLGEAGGFGTGVVTVSWENALTELTLQLWDLDLSEQDIVTSDTADGLTFADDGTEVVGGVVTGSSADLPNSSVTNFIPVVLSGDAITDFTVGFQRPGSGSGGHAIGFGEFVPVPTPGAVAVVGVAALAATRRRR